MGGGSGTLPFLFNGSRDFLLRAAYAFGLKERPGLEMGLVTEEHSPLGVCGSALVHSLYPHSVLNNNTFIIEFPLPRVTSTSHPCCTPTLSIHLIGSFSTYSSLQHNLSNSENCKLPSPHSSFSPNSPPPPVRFSLLRRFWNREDKIVNPLSGIL